MQQEGMIPPTTRCVSHHLFGRISLRTRSGGEVQSNSGMNQFGTRNTISCLSILVLDLPI